MRTIVLILAAATASCTRSSPPAPAKTDAAPVRITQFYASPPNPPKGEKALVCYGIENAAEVKIDPPVERLWPAIARCFDFVPTKEITLTLTAARGSERVSQSIQLKPGPPAVKLLLVSINKLEFEAGELATICFRAKDAVSVTIKPGRPFAPYTASLGCVQDRPDRTTTYVVTATGAGGDVDTEKVTARVK